MSVCPRDRYGPIFSKYPHQFIVCSPDRPAYIDEDQMSFTIGTLPERVRRVTATVDVTAAESDQRLAGPWTLELTGQLQQQSFDLSGWASRRILDTRSSDARRNSRWPLCNPQGVERDASRDRFTFTNEANRYPATARLRARRLERRGRRRVCCRSNSRRFLPGRW